MKRLLFILLALIAPSLFAGTLVYREGADSVSITSEACTNAAVVKLLPEGAAKDFQAAHATVGGKDFAGCWIQIDEERVLLVYEDGDKGLIPAALLKRELEARQ